MWLFLLAARHKMQALSALACSVGCAFSGFASLKIALFIQPYNKAGTHFTFGSPALLSIAFLRLVAYLSQYFA